MAQRPNAQRASRLGRFHLGLALGEFLQVAEELARLMPYLRSRANSRGTPTVPANTPRELSAGESAPP